MIRPAAALRRTLIFVHRWLGVALSLVFTLWFVSGIVMMYWSFPSVTAADRLQRAPVLDAARLTLSPEQAYAGLNRDQPPAQVRVTSFDGRPVYQFGGGGRGGGGRGGRGGLAVYADDGTLRSEADQALLDRQASAWTGRPIAEATKTNITEVDQWTVNSLRNVRPLYKYAFPDGQQVYVNGTTGDVVQYTTTASRFWAWLGAIPHWLYFTPLRQHQREWFSTVVYSSLIGTVASIIGLVVAIWLYSPRKRYRYDGAPTAIPYRGWKRWHTVIGLIAGVTTTTWAFSGLLSMGPFDLTDKLTEWTVRADPPDAPPEPDFGGALRGDGPFDLTAYAARPLADVLASARDFGVKEIEFSRFAGEPFYLVTNAAGDTRVLPVAGGSKTGFGTDAVLRIVREAGGRQLADLRVLDQYDAYYRDRRREAPLPVVYAELNDAASTRYYIDPGTGRIVGRYDQRGWVGRWLYNGLHSLDFPWLYNYRPLWDIVVISLMLAGTALCVTSLILTWRVLARKVAAVFRSSARPPSEDLAV